MSHAAAPFKPAAHFHAAMAQLHRWYQIYEMSSEASLHFAILAPDVVIDAPTGTVQGREAFIPRLANYAGFQNAHHVKHAEVSTISATELSLQADIIYQNIHPNGTRSAVKVHYEAQLRLVPGDLPVFTRIQMRPQGVLEDTTFVSAYDDNRAKSFMHYWLYLMETGAGDPAPFKELLSDAPALDLGGPAPTTNFEGFSAWFKTVPSWLKTSAHTVEEIATGRNSEGLLTVAAQFDWQGINVAGKPMIAKTKHNWTLQPHPQGRFATMQRMQVQVLVPFQVV